MQLFNKLPYDVILNVIIPYTYNIQNKELTQDIRNFRIDMNLLENMFYDYNEIIILNDLIRFCNNFVSPVYDIEDRYIMILMRNYAFKNKTKEKLRHYVFNYFHKTLLENTINKIRFLFGLLTPIERTRFFNRFYIDEH